MSQFMSVQICTKNIYRIQKLLYRKLTSSNEGELHHQASHAHSICFWFLSFSSRYYFNFTINSAVVNNHITTSESLWNFSYAPYDVICPDYELVREANDVSRKDICTEDD